MSLKKSIKFFSTQIRLILSGIYSLFQKKTYKKITLGREKVLALQKASPNFEKKLRILISDKF